MLLLGIDFETTGLQIGVVSVIEVGMVLWDTDLHAPVRVTGFIVDPGFNAVWEPDAEKVHGLTKDLCAKYGVVGDTALRQITSWLAHADYVVAHNGLEFDRPVLKHWAEKYGMDWGQDKLWIDTMIDLELPERSSTRLTYMAADHGFLNPFPHRAIFDVMSMMKILDAYDINAVVEAAKTPNVTVQALVSYDDRELAKRRGYHWQAEGKKWTRMIKANKIAEEEASAGFRIKVIG